MSKAELWRGLIAAVSDRELLDAARNCESAAYLAIYEAMGASTNPRWITVVAAEAAYDRGLIGEQEMDRIVGDA